MALAVAHALAPTQLSADTASAVFTLPCCFGRYTLIEQLGRGGVADVFLAEATDLKGVARRRVIKVMRRQGVASRRRRASLSLEAALAAQLRHPAIVRIEALGRQRGLDYLVMEHVEGLDLAAALARCARLGQPFPLAHRLTVICWVIEALDYAHRARDERGRPLGIVHRDLSPSNVLLGLNGEVKLCDFGIALWAQRGAGHREAIEGKAGYMSPEHARGERVDQRSDIFAAGVLLWELLQGRRMYRAPDGPSRLALAARARVPAMVVRGWLGERQLHAVARRALALEPSDRYPTVAEMRRDLRRSCAEHGLLVGAAELGAWLRALVALPARPRCRPRPAALPVAPLPSSSALDGCELAGAADVDGDGEGRPSESGPRRVAHPAPRAREQAERARPLDSRPASTSIAPTTPPLRWLSLGRQTRATALADAAPSLRLGAIACLAGVAVLHALTVLGWW